ncbi:mannosyltransferase [Savitreella phatthalungensis]
MAILANSLTRHYRIILAAFVAVILLSSFFHPSTQRIYTQSFDNTIDGIRRNGNKLWSLGTGESMFPDVPAQFQSNASGPVVAPGSEEGFQFWRDYAEAIRNAKPGFAKIREQEGLTGFPFATYEGISWDSSRADRLDVSDSELQMMRESYNSAKASMAAIAPRLPYVPGTRGIIFTVSTESMSFLTVSLRMLRKVGSRLPVEVWIWDRKVEFADPYLMSVCDKLWAPLNVRCMYTTDYQPPERPAPLDEESKKFQNKLDAMMSTTFEEFLFMDSDNIAVFPPDGLFVEAPFKDIGYTLWPDYWVDSSAKYFYDFSDIPEPNIRERASSESGQFMMSKATHASALLMASYYMRYGESHYEQLFTQGAMGMGDKEAFLKGAQAMELPFYQVVEKPERVGYRCDGGERAIGSGQHHPGDDLKLRQYGIKSNSRDLLNDRVLPRIQFIHGNLPKYDPARYLDWYDPSPDGWNDQLRCGKGKGLAHRLYGPKWLTMLKFGWDIDKAIFDQMLWSACATEEYQVTWWEPCWWNTYKPRLNVCKRFTEFHEELFLKQENLPYDPSLKSPFSKGGEYEQAVVQGLPSSWNSGKGTHRWGAIQA